MNSSISYSWTWTSVGPGNKSIHPVYPLCHFLEGWFHTFSSILTASGDFVPYFSEDTEANRGELPRVLTYTSPLPLQAHITSPLFLQLRRTVSATNWDWSPHIPPRYQPDVATKGLCSTTGPSTWEPLIHGQYLISMLSALSSENINTLLIPNFPSSYCSICLLHFKHGVPEMPTFTLAFALLSSCPTSFSHFHHSPKDSSMVLKPIINAQP